MNIKKIGLTAFRWIGYSCVLATMPMVASAHSSNAWESLKSRNTLTGSWGGVRDTLKKNGFDFFGAYLSMYNANVSGGEKRTDTYAQQIALGMNVNLAKIDPIFTGNFKFLSSVRFGNQLSTAAVGNFVPVQAIVGGGEGFRIVNVSYSTKINNGNTYINIGFLPLGDNYAAIQDFIHLQSAAFNEHAIALYAGRGWTDFPIGHWGAMIKQNFSKNFYGQIGAWDVNPTSVRSNHMVYFSTLGSTGVIIPIQFGFHTDLGNLNLPGEYVLGGYYDTSKSSDIANPEVPRQGKFGGYAYLKQTIYKNHENPNRSISLFAEIVGADSKTATIPGFYALGLIGKNIFPSHYSNGIYVGGYAAMRNNRVVKDQLNEANSTGTILYPQYGEYGIDVAYSIGLTPWLSVGPNFEYIINPGAFSQKKIHNSTIVGIQTMLKF